MLSALSGEVDSLQSAMRQAESSAGSSRAIEELRDLLRATEQERDVLREQVAQLQTSVHEGLTFLAYLQGQLQEAGQA